MKLSMQCVDCNAVFTPTDVHYLRCPVCHGEWRKARVYASLHRLKRCADDPDLAEMRGQVNQLRTELTGDLYNAL